MLTLRLAGSLGAEALEGVCVRGLRGRVIALNSYGSSSSMNWPYAPSCFWAFVHAVPSSLLPFPDKLLLILWTSA